MIQWACMEIICEPGNKLITGHASQRAQRAETALTAAQETLAAASDEVVSVRGEMREMRARLALTGAADMAAAGMSSPERAEEASR